MANCTWLPSLISDCPTESEGQKKWREYLENAVSEVLGITCLGVRLKYIMIYDIREPEKEIRFHLPKHPITKQRPVYIKKIWEGTEQDYINVSMNTFMYYNHINLHGLARELVYNHELKRMLPDLKSQYERVKHEFEEQEIFNEERYESSIIETKIGFLNKNWSGIETEVNMTFRSDEHFKSQLTRFFLS